jgi:mannose-6-phosphate isomerase-like protein (cupin superfamily)
LGFYFKNCGGNVESMNVIRTEDLPFAGSSWNFVGADHGDVAISFYVVDAQPGRGAPLHCHDYDEVVVVQAGSPRFLVGDLSRDAGPGDILVIKAGTPHGFVNAGSEDLRQIDIHASTTFQQKNLPATQESRLAGLPE